MKAIITVGYQHFVVSPKVAIKFLTEAKEVKSEYDGESGYTYHELSPKDIHEIEVKTIHDSAVQPAKPAEVSEVNKS